MGLITLLLNTNSLESMTDTHAFRDILSEIKNRQDIFINAGYEVGIAVREGKPDIPFEAVIDLAKAYPTIPFSWETTLDVMSIDPNRDEQFVRQCQNARRLGEYYTGPSDIVRDNCTVRLVWGEYDVEEPIDDDDTSSLEQSTVESLGDILPYINNICKEQGTYALIENIPKDTTYFMILAHTLDGIAGKDSRVRLMADIGNLFTKEDGVGEIDMARCVSYLNQASYMIGGLHLKQVDEQGTTLDTLRKEGIIDLRHIKALMLDRQIYPVSIEPLASAGYNVFSGFEDVIHFVGLK